MSGRHQRHRDWLAAGACLSLAVFAVMFSAAAIYGLVTLARSLP